MPRKNKLMPFLLILVLALVLQVGFMALDCQNAPYRVAMEFAGAYFNLDPAMADYLRKGDASERQTAIVSNFIDRLKEDTAKRGFDLSMAKSALYHVRTKTVQKNDTEAEVHLAAYRRTAINPVFLFTAQWFDLGKAYYVEETIRMMKEDGHWKVCSPVFDLPAGS
ncbi:MAG: hypothetical protein V2B19_30435 [Pseudomonadota bacterium]